MPFMLKTCLFSAKSCGGMWRNSTCSPYQRLQRRQSHQMGRKVSTSACSTSTSVTPLKPLKTERYCDLLLDIRARAKVIQVSNHHSLTNFGLADRVPGKPSQLVRNLIDAEYLKWVPPLYKGTGRAVEAVQSHLQCTSL